MIADLGKFLKENYFALGLCPLPLLSLDEKNTF